MKKKSKKAKFPPVVKQIFFIGIIASIIFLLLGAMNEIVTAVKLNKNKSVIKTQLEEVQKINETLKNQKSKLSDPNYIQTFARGNYMFSKEGEQIFFLPNISNDTNKNVEEKTDSEPKNSDQTNSKQNEKVDN